MSLSFPITCQFLYQLYTKKLLFSQRFKTTNESCSIPRYKLLCTLIQILITNDIFQYPNKNKLSYNESAQQTLSVKLK